MTSYKFEQTIMYHEARLFHSIYTTCNTGKNRIVNMLMKKIELIRRRGGLD